MTDARFEDAEKPLRLRAETPEDLAVLSALAQDAVGTVGDASWQPRRRRFAALVSRFRWEDRAAAEAAGRPYERVRATLLIGNVLAVRARGLDLSDPGAVFSLLAIGFEPIGDGAGLLRLRLAGGADVAVTVEALEVALTDVARPHVARAAPDHGV